MIVTVDLPDEIADVLWKEHLARVEKQADQWEKAKLSIWSKEQLVIADLVVLAKFYVEKKMIFV